MTPVVSSPLFVNPNPSSPIKIWPVLRLAVSRTDRVIGRTKFLTNSIKHKKGFRAAGDPIGCR
jgi:hypothetical protein